MNYLNHTWHLILACVAWVWAVNRLGQHIDAKSWVLPKKEEQK